MRRAGSARQRLPGERCRSIEISLTERIVSTLQQAPGLPEKGKREAQRYQQPLHVTVTRTF